MKHQGEKKYLKGILKCLVFGTFLFAYSAAWSFTIERPYPSEMSPFIPEIEKIVNDVLAETSERLYDPKCIIRKLRALDVILEDTDDCGDRTLMWTDHRQFSVVFALKYIGGNYPAGA